MTTKDKNEKIVAVSKTKETAKPQTKAAAKPQTKAAAKPQTKAAAKPQAKAAAKLQTKSQAKSQTRTSKAVRLGTLSKEDKENITSLIQTAKDAGAVEVLYIDAKDIVVDERVRLKCMVPLCRHYGDLVCPPNVLTPDEFRGYLKLYRFGILLSTEYKNPPKPASLEDSEEVSKEIRKKSYDLSEILLKMEAVALQKGYRFSAGFTGGSCHYCDNCVKTGNECKTPYRARPSMEAVGVDVVETLKKVDMDVKFPVSNNVKWWGLLLAD